MKILAVCAMGIGTSVILKINAEQAIQRLGIGADVEVADIGTARGAAASADIVLTSAAIAEEIGDVGIPVLVIDNFVDEDEIRDKLAGEIGI
ncbi:PTS sugar transporter subunit IIB [Marinitenerispora sediminis]|uniref:PTS ascorbate transporter subunit IIB n=1 Tax=Marinitenerispora sediminis TaxID=1931232 RepID=A0A368T8P6_9ACTN|nr:PTS sugar transporter subunit IIB [Marinitenerispora sediminis]RCV53524.1 PTS ascorbate transporter subunit IIB [Marinitenerispora sediminis]RCV57681.1 PTS ascorbate transporter subunit IIB [Marinitenerispora sediminis]RCV60763.1 PTS ascorbate transporter subunit IIB [Marinitenerispora sediminis]